MGHTTCSDALSTLLAAVELEILAPAIGLCLAACAGATALIAGVRELRWWGVGTVALGYVVVTSALLSTVQLHDVAKYWMLGPAAGSAAVVVVAGLCARRLPLSIVLMLGIGASIACFAITYALTAFTGEGACFFAP